MSSTSETTSTRLKPVSSAFSRGPKATYKSRSDDVEAQSAAAPPAYQPNSAQDGTAAPPAYKPKSTQDDTADTPSLAESKAKTDDNLANWEGGLLALWCFASYTYCLCMSLTLSHDGSLGWMYVNMALTVAPLIGRGIFSQIRWRRLSQAERDHRTRIKHLRELVDETRLLNGALWHMTKVGGSGNRHREVVAKLHEFEKDEEWVKLVKEYEALYVEQAERGWVFRPERMVVAGQGAGSVGTADAGAAVSRWAGLLPELKWRRLSPEEKERETRISDLRRLIHKMKLLNGEDEVESTVGGSVREETLLVSQLDKYHEDQQWMALVREFEALQRESGWVFRPGIADKEVKERLTRMKELRKLIDTMKRLDLQSRSAQREEELMSELNRYQDEEWVALVKEYEAHQKVWFGYLHRIINEIRAKRNSGNAAAAAAP